eukprot:CAMPEP_0206029122 /NCGR_PEP_ID=MMETSP1464-20131121/46193_1 /ASSEMBLY_ACC=CAM_ASM_001124 /TAXON_ID=119497 /ORGANISM="Exanthemachrysis gayraliae, Strain RCC1523" /LENGTH=85 /DNA_ID=CAMNT_0053403199 /DNA_START=1 /DNA_END=255 /DNA_ORIENTATION=+
MDFTVAPSDTGRALKRRIEEHATRQGWALPARRMQLRAGARAVEDTRALHELNPKGALALQMALTNWTKFVLYVAGEAVARRPLC